MAISKKLTALFAGVLLVGSFGLAGCDNSSSGTGANGSGSSNTGVDGSNNNSNPNANSIFDGEECYEGSEFSCFGDYEFNTGIFYPIDGSNPKYPNAQTYISRDTYREYKEYYDKWCEPIPLDARSGLRKEFEQEGYQYDSNILECTKAYDDEILFVIIK